MTVYDANSPLRAPRRFLQDFRRDLTVAPRAGWSIFVRGLQSRYRQSALRYLWLLLPPVITTLIWVFLGRSGVIDLGETAIPYAAYVGAGTVLWQLFLDALNGPLKQLSAAQRVLKNARLPHESWLIAAALDALFGLLVRCVPLAVLLAALGALPGAEIAAFPLGALAVLVLGLAVGVALAPVGLLYGDVAQAIPLLTSVGFFLTPVVYPEPSGSGLTALVAFNPLTPVLMTTRSWLTGDAATDPFAVGLIAGCATLAMLVGVVVYRVAQPHLVARL